MVTPADIVNRAIQLIGGFNNNQAITGSPPLFDRTTIGVAAGTVYNAVVQTIARKFGYDFSRNIATLGLTGGTAPLNYAYEYFYPTNGIQVRQLVPPTFADANNPTPIRSTIGNVVAPFSAATGSINFVSTNPVANDTITLNGNVFTFASGGVTPTNFKFLIGGGLANTLANMLNLLPPNGYNSTPSLTVTTYSTNVNSLLITYNTLGPSGNAYTLAASRATVSAATLTGGANAQQKVIWTNLQNALASFTNQPVENTWDALFTEEVVRLLASELALAVPGKPGSSQLAFEQFQGFEQAGEQRFDT